MNCEESESGSVEDSGESGEFDLKIILGVEIALIVFLAIPLVLLIRDELRHKKRTNEHSDGSEATQSDIEESPSL